MDRPDVFLPPDDRLALDALSLLSNKWEPVVIAVLLESGPLRFSELEAAIPDISPNMLTKTLESLSEHDLIDRSVVTDSPLTVSYELTDAGRDLQPVFDSLIAWGSDHIGSVRPTVILGDRDRRLLELYGAWLDNEFDSQTVSDQAQLQRRFAETPDVVVFDIDLWDDDPPTFSRRCPGTTRRIGLVGDRPAPSLCAWPCDTFLRKPLRKDELIAAVDRQVERLGQPEPTREREAIESTLSLLEGTYSKQLLETDEHVAPLYDRLSSLDDSLRET
ncbi:helix-turn-helix transcriptional regulator [Natronolimnobius sp. AArcel1]|uniref:winged helix-turn-helix transcriptional regulator n=1 Tax=Natronolimnobius sp. AArcel1 TaxID=1679093 RepID=UPI0013EAFD49|nr:helix-turn-helix domain-containing protein [Natronolimnobius sp. AArcel1]NGM70518.1 helix-turn-helix transcriptional regulator [Natronolimnobius sp. AArcel1]